MITILCGPIAAGKSTWAKSTGQVILDCDKLMLQVFPGCLGPKHDETAKNCLLYLFSLAEQLAANGIDCVIDYGFWLREERDCARAYFERRGLAYRFVYLTAKPSIRRARLTLRNQELAHAEGRQYIIDDQKFVWMEAKFQEPTAEEAVLRLDTSACSISS